MGYLGLAEVARRKTCCGWRRFLDGRAPFQVGFYNDINEVMPEPVILGGVLQTRTCLLSQLPLLSPEQQLKSTISLFLAVSTLMN